jgi:hypothetical protein
MTATIADPTDRSRVGDVSAPVPIGDASAPAPVGDASLPYRCLDVNLPGIRISIGDASPPTQCTTAPTSDPAGRFAGEIGRRHAMGRG